MAYRLVWAALFLAGLVGATFGLKAMYERNHQYNEAMYKLGLAYGENQEIGPLSEKIRQRGIEKGDVLLAVDSHQIPPNADFLTDSQKIDWLAGPEGTLHRLTVQTGTGQKKIVILPVEQANLDAFDETAGLPLDARMTIARWAAALSSLLILGASFLLFLRCPRQPVAALLSLGLVISDANRAVLLTGNADLVRNVGNFDLSALFLISALAIFPDGRFTPRWTWILIAVATLMTFGGHALPREYVILTIMALGAGIVAANSVRYFRLRGTDGRQQIKWAIIGIVGGIFFIIALNLLDYFKVQSPVPATKVMLSVGSNIAGICATACLVGGLLVSLLRYRLYDAEAVLSRSAVYGVLAVTMIIVFTATEKLIELLAHEYAGEEMGAAAAAISAGLAAAVIPVFHHRLEHWAERRFQGPLLAVRNKLPQDLRDWRETEGAREIAQRALDRISIALRSQTGAVIARGAEDVVLAGHPDDAAAMPLKVLLGPLPDGSEGILLLGPRPDGSPPGKDEREAAQAIADPLGRALAVAQRRQAHEQELRDTLESMSARIRKLEKTRARAKS